MVISITLSKNYYEFDCLVCTRVKTVKKPISKTTLNYDKKNMSVCLQILSKVLSYRSFYFIMSITYN